MACDALLNGLNGPLKITVWPWTFLVPFLDLPIWAELKEGDLEIELI